MFDEAASSLLKWGIGTVPIPAIHVCHGRKIVYESKLQTLWDDAPQLVTPINYSCIILYLPQTSIKIHIHKYR